MRVRGTGVARRLLVPSDASSDTEVALDIDLPSAGSSM